MVMDLMGEDDAYGDEYGDYGDESGANLKVAEPDNDFM